MWASIFVRVDEVNTTYKAASVNLVFTTYQHFVDFTYEEFVDCDNLLLFLIGIGIFILFNNCPILIAYLAKDLPAGFYHYGIL